MNPTTPPVDLGRRAVAELVGTGFLVATVIGSGIAASRLSRRQMDRICTAALLYACRLPDGAMTDIRFDAALVDAQGALGIVENAFGAD